MNDNVTFYSFRYPSEDSAIHVDVWYEEDGQVTISALHVDKHSAVSQLFRDRISHRFIANNRDYLERMASQYVESAMYELIDALPIYNTGTCVLSEEIVFGISGFVFEINDDGDVWQMQCIGGTTTPQLKFLKQSPVIMDNVSKEKCPTAQDAMKELRIRFTIECLGMVNDVVSKQMIG